MRVAIFAEDAEAATRAAEDLLGLPLFLRAALAAQAAGAREIVLVAPEGAGRWRDRWEGDRRLRIPVRWGRDLLPAGDGSGFLLLLRADAAVDAAAMGAVRAAAEGGLVGFRSTDGVVGVVPAGVLGGGAGGPELAGLLARQAVRPLPAAGVRVRVRAPADVSEAERALLRTVAAPLDSPWIDRRFNRRLSPVFTRWFLRTPLSANAVTLLGAAPAFLGVWFLTRPAPAGAWLAFLCFALWVVLDHSDGEVARLRFQESAFGQWLDHGLDLVIYGCFVLAMAWVGGRLLARPSLLLAGILAAFGTVLSGLVAIRGLGDRKHSLDRPRGRGERLLQGLANRDGFYALLLLFALLRTLWPAGLGGLIWVTGLGSNLYWLLAVRMLRRARG